MLFMLVLCGLVAGVYLLLTALLLFVGLYGVFGAMIYGPVFLIRYVCRVFDGRDALDKSYDLRKKQKMAEPREASNKRLTDNKTRNMVSSKAGTPRRKISYEVEAPGITVNPPITSSPSRYPDMV